MQIQIILIQNYFGYVRTQYSIEPLHHTIILPNVWVCKLIFVPIRIQNLETTSFMKGLPRSERNHTESQNKRSEAFFSQIDAQFYSSHPTQFFSIVLYQFLIYVKPVKAQIRKEPKYLQGADKAWYDFGGCIPLVYSLTQKTQLLYSLDHTSHIITSRYVESN